MPRIGSALGYDLYLRSGGTVEIRRLIRGIDFKLLDAIQRSRHYTGRTAPDLVRDRATGRIAGETGRVHLHAAIHVVGVLTAIEHEGALVDDRASDAAIRRNARLQSHEGGCVAANRWQVLQRIAPNGVTDRGVHGLQLRTGGGDFYGLRNGSQLKLKVYGQRDSYRRGNDRLGDAKTGLAGGYLIVTGRDVGE